MHTQLEITRRRFKIKNNQKTIMLGSIAMFIDQQKNEAVLDIFLQLASSPVGQTIRLFTVPSEEESVKKELLRHNISAKVEACTDFLPALGLLVDDIIVIFHGHLVYNLDTLCDLLVANGKTVYVTGKIVDRANKAIDRMIHFLSLCDTVNLSYNKAGMDDFPQLTLITGPMFAGKTKTLIREMNKTSRKAIIIKYKWDTRYGDGVISQDGDSFQSYMSTVKLMDVVPAVELVDVVGIDEGQFFEDLSEFCALMKTYGKKIIVAGLISSDEKKPFPNMIPFIPLCDSVNFLFSVCDFCHEKKASFSKRHTNDKKREGGYRVGGKDIYKAACRICF